MTPPEAFVGWLSERPAYGEDRVIGWRVEIAETEAIRIGIRDSQLGGPYEAPGVSTRLGGSLTLAWSDGQVTRTQLDRAAVEAPNAELADWRAVAALEGRPVVFAPSAAVPEVQVYDPDLARAVSGAPSTLSWRLAEIKRRAAAAGVRRLDATLRASVGRRIVASSAGFECGWDETAFALELWTEEVADTAFTRRRSPGDGEIATLLDDVVARGQLLRREDGLPPTARGVIFMPSAVEALLGRFFPGPLTGRSIVDGRSPFTRADVENGRRILRPDLSLIVDTTIPFALASSPCSSDGVPGGRVALVRDGRLAAPILDLATAVELRLPPTPGPRGRPILVLDTERERLDLAAALALLGEGVIVRDLPGLHTQGAQRWSYALVAPDAQAVQAGAPAGRASARLRGNVLEHLNAGSTCLVRVPGETNPALLVTDGVVLESA